MVYPAAIDAATLGDITEAAAPHDTTRSGQVARWLGGELCRVEASLSDALPEGWYARVEPLKERVTA